MVRHAQDEAPLECCGLLSSEAGVITRHHPMRNILQSEIRYEMDARELFQFFKELRTSGRRHLGIYHSHPASNAYPSSTDVQQSFYPDCAYFIISLQRAHAPVVNAFRIVEQAVLELSIIEI